jgi:O-antigen/teichoic acid export membrane protein
MFRNIFYSLITKATVAHINFAILLISSRYLGVSTRGEISIFLLNITLIQVLSEVYTGYSIVHFIPKFNFKKIVGFGLCYSLCFVILGNLVIVGFHKQVEHFEGTGALVSMIVVLNTFNCVLLLGRGKLALYNLLSFLQPLLLAGGLIFSIKVLKMYTFGAYIFPLLFSFIIAFVISAFAVLRLIGKGPLQYDFSIQPLLLSGFLYQASILMFITANRYSYYLLPRTSQVGLYSSACSFVESALIIVNGIGPVLLSRVANEGDSEKNTGPTLGLARLSFLLSTFMLLVILLLPEDLLLRVLGNGFKGISRMMLLYAPGIMAMSFAGIFSVYFNARGKQRFVLLSYLSGFLASIFLAPPLIRHYDLAGAAFSANIAYFLMALTICIFFIRHSRISFRQFFLSKAGIREIAGNLKNADKKERVY